MRYLCNTSYNMGNAKYIILQALHCTNPFSTMICKQSNCCSKVQHCSSLPDLTFLNQPVYEATSWPVISCSIHESSQKSSIYELVEDWLNDYMSSMKGPQV